MMSVIITDYKYSMNKYFSFTYLLLAALVEARRPAGTLRIPPAVPGPRVLRRRLYFCCSTCDCLFDDIPAPAPAPEAAAEGEGEPVPSL